MVVMEGFGRGKKWIWRICTTEEQKQCEIVELKENLLANNYPINIIEVQINNFINRKQKPPTEKDPEMKKCFLSLPYINDKSEKIASKMS